MVFNFRKIASVVASAVMVGSTVAVAAAANYPAPFVANGNANVALVYGSKAAPTDYAAVIDITSNLQGALARQTATTTTSGTTSVSVTGEAVPLFTGASKIYMNDSLNNVKAALTKTDLPTILADQAFSGNVDATYTQTITLGTNPTVTFAKQPTSESEPQYALTLSTNTANPLYNASITFNKAVALNHSDSEGQELTLFGQKFTIASATDATDLVLLKSAERVSLSSTEPTAKVTVGGKEYTIELVSVSSDGNTATVKVTDANGASESKDVTKNGSKKVQGLTVAVTSSSSNNLKYSASIIAGAQKITLTDGSAVTVGDDATTVDGTKVAFTGTLGSLTKLTVQVAAPDSDHDALLPGQSFTDPVFGSFKIDFPALNIPANSSSRENIVVKNSGDDKMEITFADYNNKEKTFQWAQNNTASLQLQVDSDGHNITVMENQAASRNDYIVVGNEANAHILKVAQITNQTTGIASDKVKFTDVMSGDSYEATLTDEGVGTVTIGGQVYSLKYFGAATDAEETRSVRLNYPDSTGNTVVVYPSITTSKGAKLAFYKPLTIAMTNWDGAGNTISGLRLPDGDGYTDVAITGPTGAGETYSIGGSNVNTNATYAAGASSKILTVGSLTYNITNTGTANQTKLYLSNPSTGAVITDPALVLFEEKDDNSNYQAMVITLEPGATSDDGIGVSNVLRTWSSDSTWPAIALPSDSHITKKADLYGSIVTLDASDSDQQIATISYPDEQLYAQIYAGQSSAALESTGGTPASSGNGTVKELGSVAVSDAEVSSVAGKNLIVVGGSCVNSVAAELLGVPANSCGSAFETKAGVSNNQFLIKTFARGGQVATLVAGYNAIDTTNAAKYLTTQTVDTTVGKAYKGTSATSASLMTETATTTGNSTNASA